VVFI